MSPAPDFFLKANDTASTITSTLKDANDLPVDIQGALISFRMAPFNGSGTPALNASATNAQNGTGVDGTKGNVSYTWQAADSDVTGWFKAEWVVTYADNKIQTFPNAGYLTVLISAGVL